MSLDSQAIDDAMKFYDRAKGQLAILANCIYSYGANSSWAENVKEKLARSELKKHKYQVDKLVNEINEKYSEVPTALELKKILQEGMARLEKIALPYTERK